MNDKIKEHKEPNGNLYSYSRMSKERLETVIGCSNCENVSDSQKCPECNQTLLQIGSYASNYGDSDWDRFICKPCMIELQLTYYLN